MESLITSAATRNGTTPALLQVIWSNGFDRDKIEIEDICKSDYKTTALFLANGEVKVVSNTLYNNANIRHGDFIVPVNGGPLLYLSTAELNAINETFSVLKTASVDNNLISCI